MNNRYRSSMLAPIMIGAGLMISGGLIASLATAETAQNIHTTVKIVDKKRDANNDGH